MSSLKQAYIDRATYLIDNGYPVPTTDIMELVEILRNKKVPLSDGLKYINEKDEEK